MDERGYEESFPVGKKTKENVNGLKPRTKVMLSLSPLPVRYGEPTNGNKTTYRLPHPLHCDPRK